MTARRSFLSSAAASAFATALASAQSPTNSTQNKPAIAAKVVHTQPLPEPFTGWEARFVEVGFPANVKSTAHQHPGFVLGYVVEGEFRFAINGEEPRVLHAGQAFYEPPGANHTVGDSASDNRPAKVLAIIVARAGAHG